MRHLFVYFIRPIGMDGPVKIGCSADPELRLSSLLTWSPFPLEVVATIPNGSLQLEQNIHECFADLFSHREWFRADPRITAVIDKLRAGVPIAEALDLSARIGHLRRNRRPSTWWTEGVRYAASVTARTRHAARHLREIGGDPERWLLPDYAEEIVERAKETGVRPSEADIHIVDECIDDPAKHLVTFDERYGREEAP